MKKLSPDDDFTIYRQFLTRTFGRKLREGEFETWIRTIADKPEILSFIKGLMKHPAISLNPTVAPHSPDGHFLNPVVDPTKVRDYVAFARESVRSQGPSGIEIDLNGMEEFWNRHASLLAAAPWTNAADQGRRYGYRVGPYQEGDALTLYAKISQNRPKRIIEIGSGASTACMLDALDFLDLQETQITCIEPYPGRLHKLLHEQDRKRVKIVENGVEQHPLDVFAELEKGDILFIDSTHVLKTGSDVHYELFHILPVLAPGVVVHVHDCRWPFEYNDGFIFEKNFSWNEIYAVRLLLMDSNRYRLSFWGSCFAEKCRELVKETVPIYLNNPGSAIWFEVM